MVATTVDWAKLELIFLEVGLADPGRLDWNCTISCTCSRGPTDWGCCWITCAEERGVADDLIERFKMDLTRTRGESLLKNRELGVRQGPLEELESSYGHTEGLACLGKAVGQPGNAGKRKPLHLLTGALTERRTGTGSGVVWRGCEYR
jgi:hypothetical protein